MGMEVAFGGTTPFSYPALRQAVQIESSTLQTPRLDPSGVNIAKIKMAKSRVCKPETKEIDRQSRIGNRGPRRGEEFLFAIIPSVAIKSGKDMLKMRPAPLSLRAHPELVEGAKGKAQTTHASLPERDH